MNISNMTIEMSDARKFFWQWDTGCKLRLVDAEEGIQVHFYRDGMEEPLVVFAYALGDEIVCDIPDEMLQIAKKFAAYTYTIDEVGRKTYVSKVFIVETRPKPVSYIYTPTERYHVEEVVEETVRKLFVGELSRALIEVDELPTEDIRSIIFYRTADGIYWHDGEWHRLIDAGELGLLSDALEAHKTAYNEKITEIEQFNTEDANNLALHISEYNKKMEALDLADSAHTNAIDANALAISAEVARSTDTDKALDAKIDDEIARQDQDIANATATANEAKTTADTLNDTIQTALEHSTETRDLLNKEIARATEEEGKNKTAISVEEARAKGEEQKNATAIDNEKTRAETAEANITNALNAHKTSYDNKVAEIEAFNTQDAQNLASHISTYNKKVSDLEVADQAQRDALSQALAQLEALLEVDDTKLNALQDIVDYIKSNKTSIDAITINKVNVSDIVDHLLSLETAKPLSANQGRILKEIIDTFKSTYDNKVAELERKDTANENAIIAETNRAKQAEQANTEAIQAESARATAAEDTNATNIAKNAQDISTNKTAIASEESRAKLAEQSNLSKINSEIDRAKLAEQANTNAIGAEETRAKGEETRIENLLKEHKETYNAKVFELETNHQTDAKNLSDHIKDYGIKVAELDAEDKALDAKISANSSANKTNAENISKNAQAIDKNKTDIATNKANIEAEKSRAEGKEAELLSAINAEATRAQGEEQNLTNAIGAERDRALAAEQSLDDRVTTNNTLAQNAVNVATSTLDTASRAKTIAEQTQTTLNQEIEQAAQTHQAFSKALSDEESRATKKEGEIVEELDKHKKDFNDRLDEHIQKYWDLEGRVTLTEDFLVDRIEPLEEKVLHNRDIALTNGSKGLAYQIHRNGGIAICSGIGQCKDINLEIASMVMGLPVVKIAENAFEGTANIKNIYIPEGVGHIGANAFFGCNLEEVTIIGNDEHVYIDELAFANTGTIKTLVFGCREVEIEEYAFDQMVIEEIKYVGTQEDWENFASIQEVGNSELFIAPITFNYEINRPSPYGNIYTYE